MQKERFNFEDLDVWQKAVDYSVDVITVAEGIIDSKKHYRLIENIEAAATSIATNIAEGRGRQSKKEFIQYLFISKGSLFEVITTLTIFYKKGWISSSHLETLKDQGAEIGKMLSTLINTIRKSFS